MKNRIITPEIVENIDNENSIRPLRLSDYIGQENNIAKLKIFLEATKIRDEALDHVLLYGPPGLGKTTLAGIIANEMGVNIKVTSGPAIERAGDLAAILSSLKENDVLFIDEIHRLNRNVEEVLYPAMEDFTLDILIGKGPMARSVRLDLPKFTLIGATTRAGDLSSPLRDRFGVVFKMEPYKQEELEEILTRSARVLKLKISEDASREIAMRSRGTPRIVNRILKRVGDYATVMNDSYITKEIAFEALRLLEIDDLGLDQTDIKLLRTMIELYGGGPIGIDTIAASTNEEKRTIEDVYEPYLIQIGFLKRTNRGRVVLEKAYRHLGLPFVRDNYLEGFNFEVDDEEK